VAKYLNSSDSAPALANADNQAFNYSLGNGNDALNLAISASNLAAAGTGTREDFVLNINAGIGDDVISTAIVNDSGANGNGAVLQAPANEQTPWYINSTLNANLNIDAGAGNDVVNTLGSGNWKVNLGAGNDTYYADNTAGKAQWVFNTANQTTAVTPVARTITGAGLVADVDLPSDTNNGYIFVNDGIGAANAGRGGNETSGLYGLKLRVAFNDVSLATANALPDPQGQGTYFSEVIEVPTATDSKYRVTDLNINQAIKAAINGDPVLSKLLKATDGPGNTLVVTALSDGRHVNVNDLQVEFAIPTAAGADAAAWAAAIGGDTTTWTGGVLQEGRVAAFYNLINKGGAYTTTLGGSNSTLNNYGPNAGTGYSDWYTANPNNNSDYKAAFANDGSADILGSNSRHTADNTIDAGTGIDVIVLSTGEFSNDTIKWTGYENGTTTVVNFDTGADTPSTEAVLEFTLIVGAGTVWSTAGYTVNDTFTITVAGVGTTGTITAGANDPTTGAAVQAALDALFLGAGWSITNTTPGTPGYTQSVPELIPGLGGFSFTKGIDVAPAQPTAPATTLFDATTITPASITTTLGDDWLDFTAYGAKWLGATTLGTNGYALTTWEVTTDQVGAHTVGAVAANQGLATWQANNVAIYKGDLQVHTGDKYITLTRAAPTTTADPNPHSATLYKVELWTVNGNAADAYLETLVGTDVRDSAQLIGFVDLGKAIDDATTAADVLSHVDYIA
jgi:hypothetical protein